MTMACTSRPRKTLTDEICAGEESTNPRRCRIRGQFTEPRGGFKTCSEDTRAFDGKNEKKVLKTSS